MVSSAFKLFDARLVSITEKLNDVSERQKSMEESMKLLHDTVRKISVPAPQPLPPAPPSPTAECHQVSTPAFLRSDEQLWWFSNSILGDNTVVPPTEAQSA